MRIEETDLLFLHNYLNVPCSAGDGCDCYCYCYCYCYCDVDECIDNGKPR